MASLLTRYPVAATVLLLTCSNLFMTIAWYGHLKNTRSPLIVAIVVSWAIALLEYCFQVPANRIGYSVLTLTQLKILQEVITLIVFTLFAFVVFGQAPKWNYGVSYGATLIVMPRGISDKVPVFVGLPPVGYFQISTILPHVAATLLPCIQA